jgi:hypothetical protein
MELFQQLFISIVVGGDKIKNIITFPSTSVYQLFQSLITPVSSQGLSEMILLKMVLLLFFYYAEKNFTNLIGSHILTNQLVSIT